VADKKVRIRKAPTVREQTEAARPKTEAGVKSRTAVILRPLRLILRPLRWLVPTYFLNSWREVRQVTWPNRRETWRLTIAVFIFAIVFGSLVAGVDKVLDLVFKKVILKQ
jgi:preprotein translocase SecE subunit